MDPAGNEPQESVMEGKSGRNKEMRVLVMGLGRSGTTGKAALCQSGILCQALNSHFSFGIRTQTDGLYPL